MPSKKAPINHKQTSTSVPVKSKKVRKHGKESSEEAYFRLRGILSRDESLNAEDLETFRKLQISK